MEEETCIKDVPVSTSEEMTNTIPILQPFISTEQKVHLMFHFLM